ncbi:MAG: hypothetical protein ACI4I7_04175 [Oscillospiraceae bacterium]
MDNDFILTDDLMEKVNKFTRKTLSAEEIYAFPVILCDNEIDRDNERFSIDALRKLAPLFIGKTGIFDHNPKGENQTARIFDTEVKTYTDRVTSAGEPYTCLIAKAYMVRTAKSADLISEIEGGIKKEVSVSCSVKKQLCSICGADMKKSPCTHIKGAKYGDKICSVILDEPFDAYEWSFVAVPAQKNAGITKKYGGKTENEEIITAMKSEIAELKKENAEAKELLKREILRLSFLCNPILTVKTVGILTEKMSFRQLTELKENLEKDLQAKSCSEEKKQAGTFKPSENKSFKIN